MADTTKISRREWLSYIERLRKLNEKAADSVREYVSKNGGTANVDRQSLIDYAYGVATKYGEGSATLSAEMYDAVAQLEGKNVKSAVPADTPTYGEVAKIINGIIRQSNNENMLASGVGRLVKRTGVDTVMNNALRDGAEWAWIPVGDTCAFCITLASQGWVRASRKAIKNGHAEHIHANCDCTYAVRFDSNLEVEGYDPEEYRKMYYGAGGKTPEEKINAMRRMQYAERKDVINAQKRAAYAERKRTNELMKADGRSIMNVSTGLRNEKPLSKKEIDECVSYATSLGMPYEKIKYSNNYYTAYSPLFDILLIGTDVLPKADATTINGMLTMKCAIAHEIVGHREASLNGISNFAKDDPRDEAQASIRAARFAPGLSMKERNMLIMDAITRLHNGGYKVRDVKYLLDIFTR